MSILEIIEELNLENGTKYKESVLIKYKNNELFKRVLKMTYDKAIYTYGVTMKNIVYEFENNYLEEDEYSLEMALDELENNFCTRKITGNEALDRIKLLLETLKTEEAIVFEKVIDRDLKINLGKTLINKVFKELIVKPCYMRCGIFSLDSMKNGKLVKGTARDIKFPASLQLKADGMAIFTRILEDEVICYTRSGEEFYIDSLQKLKENKLLVNHIIQGEFLIKNLLNRSLANGLLNSLIKYKQGINDSLSKEVAKEIEDAILYQIWDIFTLEEYKIALNKDKKNICKTKYVDRLKYLEKIF